MSTYKKSSAVWWIGGGLIFFVLLLLLIGNSANPTAQKTNREIALTCTTDMATQFHIHPHIAIIVNGQQQPIPAHIGINANCMNPLHTHDASGAIHIESPQKRDFTLADFFAVWAKTFTQDQILEYKTDATHVIRETVNDKEVHAYENTVLHDDDQVMIYYEEKK